MYPDVFLKFADPDDFEQITEQFKGNLTFPAGDDLSAEEFLANAKQIKGLIPAATRLAREMELPAEDPPTLASVAEFVLEGLLRGNTEARAAFYTSMANLGVYSVNEIREREGLNRVEGGDARFVPLNMGRLNENESE